jgi:membrane associated rhomboid family serine protease
MPVEIPDPSSAGSSQTRADFWLAANTALAFVAVLWVIQLSNWGLDMDLERFGVRPRQLAGLPGILLAPLVHAGFTHLIANSLPLAVLGTTMLHLYPKSALRV